MDFASILRKNARQYADNPAVVFERRRQTYAQLYQRACRLADALLALGLRKGDRVATLGDNMFETIEEICAFALVGLIRAPMYAQNPADVHLYMLNLVGAKALIVQDRYYQEFASRIGEAPKLEHVIVHGQAPAPALDYDKLMERAKPEDPRIPMDENDVHIIRFSAGTTGRPKGIAHTVRGFLQLGNEVGLVLPRIDDSDAMLVAGPMSHASGIIVWMILAHAARQVLLPAFHPALALEVIEKERCTITILVPTMIQILANHPDAKTRDLSTLKAVFYGASPIAERTLADAQKIWGNIMYQVYGQSEVLPITMLAPRHHVLEGTAGEKRWLRSAGRTTPNAFVKILDDAGQELPTGEVGEITVRSPGAMKEIWQDEAATRERITKDGWIRTRDIGSLDDDGFLYIADRKEDMIISGGFNIWPAELENALFSHPSVLEAAVVGVPHEKWGETPRAIVVLREGQSATEQELIDWCGEKAGRIKKPTSIQFRTEALPKSPVGKVLRRQLREQYWGGKQRHVGGA